MLKINMLNKKEKMIIHIASTITIFPMHNAENTTCY